MENSPEEFERLIQELVDNMKRLLDQLPLTDAEKQAADSLSGALIISVQQMREMRSQTEPGFPTVWNMPHSPLQQFNAAIWND